MSGWSALWPWIAGQAVALAALSTPWHALGLCVVALLMLWRAESTVRAADRRVANDKAEDAARQHLKERAARGRDPLP